MSGRSADACRCSPAAKSRWITLSCSSRAIRSRSSSTSSRVCGLDESGCGLEPLADVAHRRHRCRDLTQFAAQRTERDLDGHFATRAMQRREQQTTAHRPRPRIVGVSLSVRGVPTVQASGDQRLDRLAHQLLRRPADDLAAVVVRVPDEPVGVDHDDHLGNALEQHPRIQRGIGHPVVLSPDSHLHPRRGVVEVGDRATRRADLVDGSGDFR